MSSLETTIRRAGRRLAVEQQERQAGRERRQDDDQQDRVDLDRPDEQRQPRPAHPLRAQVVDRDDEVDRSRERRDREHVQRQDPEVLTVPLGVDGVRRVARPAAPGRASLREEREQQDDAPEEEEPVGERVQAREGHVPGADHQRDEVVGEAGEDRDDDEEDHRRPVDREELVVGVVLDEVLVRLGELCPDQQRHDPAGDEEEPSGREVEDPDPLVVDRDEPTCDAAAMPGRSGLCGLDVNRH